MKKNYCKDFRPGKDDFCKNYTGIKTGLLHVKGKNGLERDITLRPQIRRMFVKILEDIPRGEKLFINPDEKTHLVIKQV